MKTHPPVVANDDVVDDVDADNMAGVGDPSRRLCRRAEGPDCARGLIVSAFYISNVEQYLVKPRSAAAPGGQEINGGWRAFYDNLATLPTDDATILLRVPISPTMLNLTISRTRPDGTVVRERRGDSPPCHLKALLAAVGAGRVATQADATACGR